MKKALLFLMALTLWPGVAATQTNASIRLALIAPEAALRPAVDLLTVELSRDEKIVLLERAEIERLLREQSLAATSPDYLKLGQVLGADGLLVAEIIKEGATNAVALRLVAVKPGVVLGTLRSPWPVADVGDWVKGIPGHFAPLVPKLGVLAKDAVPISVVNLRAAVSSRETRELEQQLTLLAIERLTRERELFVLERRRLDLLSVEKELKSTDDSAFWNGSYLLDGVIDRDGYSKERVTLNARLVPPAGGVPLELNVAAPRTNLAELAEQLTACVLQSLKRESRVAAWQPEAEARKYLEEAKWALKWGLTREAQAASEAAWALGIQSDEVAELRVRAWRESGTDLDGCYIARGFGWVSFTGPPDAERFKDLMRAAELYDSASETLKLSQHWYDLGHGLVNDLSNWLRHYYFTVEARAGLENSINGARELARRIFNRLSRHPDFLKCDPGRRLLATAAHLAAFWAVTPEEGLAFHRQMMDSGHWPWVRRRFLYVGHFAGEDTPSDGSNPSSDYSDPASPPLAGWAVAARHRGPAVWQSFIEELCSNTNGLVRLEGHFLRCSFAWSNDEFERELSKVLAVVREEKEAIFNAKVQTNLLADLKLLAGVERIGGFPPVDMRVNHLTPELKQRVNETIWNPFEQQFSQSMRSVAVDAEFEKVKDYFRTRNEFDSQSFVPFTSRDYDARQAKELLPLLAAYHARVMGDTNQPESAPFKMRRRNLGYWTGQLENKLKSKLAPPATNTTPGGPLVGSKPPATIQTPAKPAVTVPLTQPMTTRFWSAKSAGIKLKNPIRISLADACWRENRLWVQLNYVEQDNATGTQEEQCVVAIVEPDSFGTKAISLRDQIPSHEGGGFQVPIQNRIFEVLNNQLFISTGTGLKKCSLQDGKWEDLNLPVSGKVRLQRLNNRIFATTADSILELDPDGSGVKILASSRREPPLTTLDRIGNYGTPPQLSPPPLFSLGRGDVKTYLHGKAYSLNSGATDWVVVGDLPVGPWVSYAAEDGLFLQRSPPAGRGELWGMFGGKESLDLLLAQPAQSPSLISARLPTGLGNTSTNRPKWNLPADAGTLGPVCADGETAWIFSGGLAFEMKDDRAEVKEQPDGHRLWHFAPGAVEAAASSVRLDVPGDALPPLALRHLVSQGNFGDRVLRAIPSGLVLARSGLPGFWLIPRSELEKRITKQ